MNNVTFIDDAIDFRIEPRPSNVGSKLVSVGSASSASKEG